MPQRVRSGERSTSAGLYISPLFLPLPLFQQVEGSPQLADQTHLHLCQKLKEDKTR